MKNKEQRATQGEPNRRFLIRFLHFAVFRFLQIRPRFEPQRKMFIEQAQT